MQLPSNPPWPLYIHGLPQRTSEEIRRAVYDLFQVISSAFAEQIQQGILANRPPAGIIGRFYYVTDGTPAPFLSYDDGSSWKTINVT